MCLVYVLWDAEKREGVLVPFDGTFKCQRRVFLSLLLRLMQQEEPKHTVGRSASNLGT